MSLQKHEEWKWKVFLLITQHGLVLFWADFLALFFMSLILEVYPSSQQKFNWVCWK